MKTLRKVSLLLFLCCISSAVAHAADQADKMPADDPHGDQTHLEKIEALETRLTDAKREVARLEAELAAAKRQHAATDKRATASNEPGAPIAVTRFTEEDLQDSGIRDITRIAPQVPGMIYGQTGNEARLALRGAYTNRTGPEGEPVLGIYEDGVQVTTSTDALGPYVDIESISVLRGPQGVLHGRNALAGAVVVNTNKPNPAAWDTLLEGTIGSSDLTRFEAMLNVPVLDTLAIRLAGASESYQGYVNNYVLEESDADDLKTRMQQYVRMGIRWQPTTDFSLQLNFSSLDQNGTGSGIWGYQQIGYMFRIDGEYFPGHGFAPEGAAADYGPWDVARNMGSLAELENLSTTLILDWDMDFASLRWLVNKSKFESLQAFDADYSNGGSAYDSTFSPHDAGVNGWDSFMDTWSSDLRLQSDNQRRIDWFAGLYFMRQETDWGWLETTNVVLQRPGWDEDGLFTKDSAAFYGGAGYRLGERARLFAGLRWYEDKKQLRNGVRDSWSGALWNAGIEYALTDTVKSYATASTGYRPGGISEVRLDRYDSETVTAYELGLKTQFADRTMTLDLATFLHDYQDVQALDFGLHHPTGATGLATFENVYTAGGKKSMGLEAEFEWMPDEHWHLAAQLAWLDAEFNNYTVSCLTGPSDACAPDRVYGLELDGWRPAFTPEWMLGLQVSYLAELGRWGSLRPVLHTRYVSDYYVNDLNLPGALQPAHNMTDLRLFWHLPGDKVRLQLYIENFSDEQVLDSMAIYSPAANAWITTFLADWGDPRKYGLKLSYRY